MLRVPADRNYFLLPVPRTDSLHSLAEALGSPGIESVVLLANVFGGARMTACVTVFVVVVVVVVYLSLYIYIPPQGMLGKELIMAEGIPT